MERSRARVLRILNGPTGGMLMCLLLAASLGGIAAASPGQLGKDPREHGAVEPVEPGEPASSHTAEDRAALLLPAGHGNGLRRAVRSVKAASERNPQAPGLLVALRHLAANQQRKAARDPGNAADLHSRAGEHAQGGEHARAGSHGAPADAGSQGVAHATRSRPSA